MVLNMDTNLLKSVACGNHCHDSGVCHMTPLLTPLDKRATGFKTKCLGCADHERQLIFCSGNTELKPGSEKDPDSKNMKLQVQFRCL